MSRAIKPVKRDVSMVVGFDTMAISFLLPKETAVTLMTTNEIVIHRWKPIPEQTHVTYNVPLAPGHYVLRHEPVKSS